MNWADEDSTPRDEMTYGIIGAAMAVHRELGSGFLEAVYGEALTHELADRGIPHCRQPPLAIRYKGDWLTTTYRPDFICYDQVLVEIKALKQITGQEESQVLNYLKASQLSKALLLNFGTASMEVRRYVGRQRS